MNLNEMIMDVAWTGGACAVGVAAGCRKMRERVGDGITGPAL